MKRIQIAWQELIKEIKKTDLNSDIIEFKNKEYKTEEIKIILKAVKERKKEPVTVIETEEKGFLVRFINNNEIHLKETDLSIIKRLK